MLNHDLLSSAICYSQSVYVLLLLRAEIDSVSYIFQIVFYLLAGACVVIVVFFVAVFSSVVPTIFMRRNLACRF